MAGSKSAKWWILGGIVAIVLGIVYWMQRAKMRLAAAKSWFFETKKKEYEKAIDSMTNGTAFSSVPYGPEIIHWFREYIKANGNNWKSNEIALATYQKVARDLKGESNKDEAAVYPFAASDDVVTTGFTSTIHGFGANQLYETFTGYTDEQLAHILQSSFAGGGKIGTMYKPMFWTDFSAYYEYIFKDEAQAKSIALTAYDSAGM